MNQLRPSTLATRLVTRNKLKFVETSGRSAIKSWWNKTKSVEKSLGYWNASGRTKNKDCNEKNKRCGTRNKTCCKENTKCERGNKSAGNKVVNWTTVAGSFNRRKTENTKKFNN